ncbi:hypothetical protein FA13DRAFT_1737058 [Coprinellus micaceus]|uniref:Uncharacterized protein n=1 Tax=Coprinellus micaceus TaxID=71717 RepID=A0A4Y7SYB6_COPMI|nr:hypothetical protein FA13DRAFT_1737058 [Coprinellus micaceus]
MSPTEPPLDIGRSESNVAAGSGVRLDLDGSQRFSPVSLLTGEKPIHSNSSLDGPTPSLLNLGWCV